jgi:putative ubiquitin-RnfH superfamily antitoxin RatB of RatAB toxin-antitoxin module
VIEVEVVYVAPDRTFRRMVRLADGASVREAIDASALLTECPEVDLTRQRVGIFGELVALDAVLADGDRVEVYRPLLADPKDRRRRRAQGRCARGGG